MKLLSWEYLTQSIQRPRYFWFYFCFFTLLVLVAIVLHIVADREKMPKFKKRFTRKIADFLFYIPILFQFFLLAIHTGIKNLSIPIYFFILALLWLIWFCFLLYYRLVIFKDFLGLYLKQQREEGYIYDKSTTSDKK